ncbi:RHS repeat domain-containing protein, partial [Flavobacterium psychrophilum]
PNDVPGPPVQFGPPITPTDVKAGEGFVGNGLPEKDVFYYHPDHLGSTNYVTGITGQITEHIETMAFGEILFEEHSSSFTTPYIFTGLELDRETNLTYASQRYLDMKTSIFVGVDKLAEKYPNFSGYIYAMQNPIRLTDPTGMEPVDERKIDITIPISSGYESNLQKLLNINKTGTAGINPGGDRDDSGLNHAIHPSDSYEDVDQDGRKVTKQSLGIKKGDSSETMMGKLMKGMKPGDYIDGGDLDFLNSKIGLILDKATMSPNGTLQLDRTFAGRMAGVGTDAKLSIKPQTLNGMKGYDFKLTGVSTTKIYTSGFVNDNKLYFYEKGKLFSAPIK